MNLKEKAMNLEPMIRVGKNGLADNVINEIKLILDKRKMLKVKFLKSALHGKDKKEMVRELVDKTKADLVYAVGFVAVINKKD